MSDTVNNPWPGQPPKPNPPNQPPPAQPPWQPNAQAPQQPYAPQQSFAPQQPFTPQQPYAPQQPGWQPQGVPGFPGGTPVKSGVDLSKISWFSWMIMGGAVLAFIASFLPYYSVNLGSIFGVNLGSVSANAWHGFFGWFGMVLVLAAGVVAALEIFTNFKNPMVPLLTLIGAGAGLLCILLAMFVGFSSFSRGIGYWLSFVAAAGATAGAVMIYLKAPKAAEPPAFYPAAPATGGTPPAYPPTAYPPAPQYPPTTPPNPPM